ncbi:unnamed protein product [Dovyalis caffra]|uniref:Uncharacterized protein n=1 Tax=Dovyalis caffra TaxID=77055 RepID=A0AAV1SGN9_9ROSI|nr:unnamed protein product [Dovyalis caffra]
MVQVWIFYMSSNKVEVFAKLRSVVGKVIELHVIKPIVGVVTDYHPEFPDYKRCKTRRRVGFNHVAGGLGIAFGSDTLPYRTNFETTYMHEATDKKDVERAKAVAVVENKHAKWTCVLLRENW